MATMKVLIIFLLKGEGGIPSSKGRNTCGLKPPPISFYRHAFFFLSWLPVFFTTIFLYLPHSSSLPFSSLFFPHLVAFFCSLSLSRCLILVCSLRVYWRIQKLDEQSIWWLRAFGCSRLQKGWTAVPFWLFF